MIVDGQPPLWFSKRAGDSMMLPIDDLIVCNDGHGSIGVRCLTGPLSDNLREICLAEQVAVLGSFNDGDWPMADG